MKHQVLIKKNILIVKRSMISNPTPKERMQNIQGSIIRKRLARKFHCWTCGLYQGDAELCSKCKLCSS